MPRLERVNTMHRLSVVINMVQLALLAIAAKVI